MADVSGAGTSTTANTKDLQQQLDELYTINEENKRYQEAVNKYTREQGMQTTKLEFLATGVQAGLSQARKLGQMI